MDPIDLVEAISEVKNQLLIYQGYIGAIRHGRLPDPATALLKGKEPVCGTWDIDFDIASITLELTTINLDSVGASVGATALPLGAAALDGSVSFGRSVESTQLLTFYLYPSKEGALISNVPDLATAPIAAAILNLRSAMLLAASGPGACVMNHNPDVKLGSTEDPYASFKMGLKITRVAGVGARIGLAVVNVGSSASNSATTGNTMIVKFGQRNEKKEDGDGTGVLFLPREPVCPGSRCDAAFW